MAETYKTEKSLYLPLIAWVNNAMKKSPLLAPWGMGAEIFAQDISSVPSCEGGLWSRPDVAALVYTKGRYVPSWRCELFSFEVKSATGINETAVYEAFAHTRYAHYAYLYWHTGDREPEHKHIQLCKEFGIGAMTAGNPRDFSTYRVHATAQRRDIDLLSIDRFVEERFTASKKKQIAGWLDGQGWSRAVVSEGRSE